MNLKKLEGEVKVNGSALTSLMPTILADHTDQYAVFYKGDCRFSKSFDAGINTGMRVFGSNKGFVVRKISTAPRVISALVRA